MSQAGYYARLSEQLEEILSRRPQVWQKLREGTKSDKAADRAYEGTESGIEEMKLRLRLKSLEKQMSASRSMLEVLSGEARNQF